MQATGLQKPYLVHNLPGRARIAAPVLERNPSLCAGLTGQLARLPGVRKIKGSSISGRILVYFDPFVISHQQLLEQVNDLQRLQLKSKQEELRSGEKAVPGTGKIPCNSLSRKAEEKKVSSEPEDLPLKRQLFNVVLGGTVLAALGLKRGTRGVSALAESPALFHVAAATTVITGYPVLKSGLTSFLGRRQFNFDLLMSTLSLSTLVLRESIPGLLVIWLVNFNSLVQSLLVSGSRRACKAKFQSAEEKEALPDVPAAGLTSSSCSPKDQVNITGPGFFVRQPDGPCGRRFFCFKRPFDPEL